MNPHEPSSNAEPSQPVAGWRIIALIAFTLLIWGIYHAVGAYRLNHNILRPIIVMACTLGFLSFWGIMLLFRARRLKRNANRNPEK